HALPKVFGNTVRWDILHLCMEAEFADVYPPGYYASQAYWYAHGHFPCGWRGEFSSGTLIVFLRSGRFTRIFVISQIVRQLDTRLCRHCPDYYGSLQSGVSDEALDRLQQGLTSQLPSIFLDLYRWRNGQAANCSENLTDNWMFSALEDVLSTKEMLDGMIG